MSATFCKQWNRTRARRLAMRRAKRLAAGLAPMAVLCAVLLGIGALDVAVSPAGAQLSRESVMVSEDVLKTSGDQELRWPVAVASGAADEVVVADVYGSRLLLWRRGAEGWSVEKTVTLPAPPVGVAWDGARYLVSLRGDGGLMAAEGDNLALRRLPLPGVSESSAVPGPLAGVPEGGALVYDFAGGRVLRLDRRGAVRSTVAVDGRVTALAAAPNDAFFTAVAESAQVRRHAPDGAVEETWELPGVGPVPAWPAGLAVAPDGSVVVLDRHGARMLVLQTGGEVAGFGSRQGWEPGLLNFPADVTLTPDGLVVVADEGNGRVQIFRRNR